MSHAFYRTAQGRLPKPMSSKGKTTFFLESWGKVSGILSFERLEKVRRYSFCAYVKIYTYARPKITTTEPRGGGVV